MSCWDDYRRTAGQIALVYRMGSHDSDLKILAEGTNVETVCLGRVRRVYGVSKLSV